MNYSAPLEDMTEREWTKQVYELLDLLGWGHYHTWRSKHSQAGYPDETCWKDRVLWLELKTHAKASRCSDAQKHVMRGLIRAGGEVYVIRPRDWDALGEVLASPVRFDCALAIETEKEIGGG